MLSDGWKKFKRHLYARLRLWKKQWLHKSQLPEQVQALFADGGLEVETHFDNNGNTGYFRTYVQLSGDIMQSVPVPTDPPTPDWLSAYEQHQKQLKKQLAPLVKFKQALQSLSLALSSIVSAVALWWQDWQNLLAAQWQAWSQLFFALSIAFLLALGLYWGARQLIFIWIKRHIG